MSVYTRIAYYDKVLIAIGLCLSLGGLVGLGTGLDVRTGLLAGASVATLFVYDAMFRNPPKPTPSARAKAGAVVWHVFLAALLISTQF
jgi:hypothetical protein